MSSKLIIFAALAVLWVGCDDGYKAGHRDGPAAGGDSASAGDAGTNQDLALISGPDTRPREVGAVDMGLVKGPDLLPHIDANKPPPDQYQPPPPDQYQPPVPDQYQPPPDQYQPPPPDSGGAVGPGFYTYAAVPAYGLVNPPAVAWHPAGKYALVLNATDAVYRFEAKTKKLTKVGAAGSKVYWRSVSFTPAGDKAVLLGRNTSANEGRIYLWDAAKATLSEMSGQRFAGGTYEALAYAPSGKTARVLGSKKSSGAGYLAYLWTFDAAAGLSNVKVTFTSAGCQSLAWATDSYNQPAVAVACGVNGVTLMHLNAGGQWVKHTKNAGNTSVVASRPQGDYALALCWSCSGKLYRFEQGAWNTDYNNPKFSGAQQVVFAGDGKRALLLGGYSGSLGAGQVYEYRHKLFSQYQITDVSIANFGKPPYNASSSVRLNHAAWQPGCHGGLIVGGANSYSSKKGLVIQFAVSNGVKCP